VNTIQEIEAAIRSLSPAERQKLAENLPALVPELDGDAKWERIIHDPRPRPALEKLLDETEAEREKHPEKFRETSDDEFERNS
jgi:hypothetical protein